MCRCTFSTGCEPVEVLGWGGGSLKLQRPLPANRGQSIGLHADHLLEIAALLEEENCSPPPKKKKHKIKLGRHILAIHGSASLVIHGLLSDDRNKQGTYLYTSLQHVN